MRVRLVAILFATILAAPAAAFALSVPDASVAGAAPTSVQIKRDMWGVPHVYASDAYGLFWGNGYAQAQDRLFQMDVLRHVGKGESAAYVGPAQLEMDLATRRELYTHEERVAAWEALKIADPTSAQMFQAFSDGVNAWIAETRENPAMLSAEFFAIYHAPEDWSPLDTMAIAQFLLDIFGAGSGGNELDNAKLLLELRDELGDAEAETAFNDLFWMHDASTFTTIDPEEYVYPSTEGPLGFDDVPADQWALVEAAAGARAFAGAMTLSEAAQAAGLPTKFGSNAYVISPALSENGGALLFGGPQMAYHNPMIPYEVGLHGAGFDAVGMGVGGAPGVIIGRTSDMAWTVTSGSSDQVDVVAVKLVEGSPREYYPSGESGATAAMDCRIETHYGLPGATDQSPPVLAVQEVCRTAQGPVFAINEEAGYAFSRARTHRLDELRSGLLWLTLAKNEDMASFQGHMETFCFEFNFHVADSAGNIGYFHFACQPVRDERCDPRLPRLAGMCEWKGVRSGQDLPHIVNPEKGYIVNWNNKPAQGWSSGDAIEKWGPVHRAELIERALQSRFDDNGGKVSIEDLKDINVEISTRSPFPYEFAPMLVAATASHPDEIVRDASDALATWGAQGYSWDAPDATCTVAKAPSACFGTYDPGFAIYETWREIAQEAAFRDEMGPHVREMGFVPETSSDPHAADHGREDNKDNALWTALQGDTAHDWLDATPEAFLVATFEDAVAQLIAEYGTTDVTLWRQDAYTIKFVALSGGPAWRIPMVNRPSFNHWYDFGSGDAGSALPPGTNQYWLPTAYLQYQGDGTMPAHKRDQLDLYVAFEYKPAQLTPPAGWESEITRTPCPGGCPLV